LLLWDQSDQLPNMIGLGTLALLENPDTLARIRDTDDPKVISGAVEELLRYLTIVHSLVARVTKEDIEIGGTLVEAGEMLIMNLSGADRDPAFLDAPDILDIDRKVLGHMAFGHGVHQCLGQTLARAELEIALPTLLRRLPGLRLAVPIEEIRFRGDMGIYGVRELPVTWDQPYRSGESVPGIAAPDQRCPQTADRSRHRSDTQAGRRVSRKTALPLGNFTTHRSIHYS
jgi:cytochrome P450